MAACRLVGGSGVVRGILGPLERGEGGGGSCRDAVPKTMRGYIKQTNLGRKSAYRDGIRAWDTYNLT